MSMINLEKCQAIDHGNISDVVHSAVMQNGYFVNMGALSTTGDAVYNVGVPATGTLATAEVLVVFNDETIYNSVNTNISSYSIAIGERARAYHMTVGDEILFQASILSGTLAVGSYLAPANASMQPTITADISAIRFAMIITEATTIGYTKEVAYRARVIKA
jgi:hypothetical protein